MSFEGDGVLPVIAIPAFGLLLAAGLIAMSLLMRSLASLVLGGWDEALKRLQGTNKRIKACPPAGAPSAGHQAIAHAEYALNLLASVVPSRIANEEIGDALEIIHAMVKAQWSAGSIYLKVARTYFWVCVHTAMEKFVGVVKLAMGAGDDWR